MPVTRRHLRLWLAVLALVLGWFVFTWGRMYSSPMWYDECEGVPSPFLSSLHCAAPFLCLTGGAALILAGGVLLLLELFRQARAVSPRAVLVTCVGVALYSLMLVEDSPALAAVLFGAPLLFLAGRLVEGRVRQAPAIASVLVMALVFAVYVAGQLAALRTASAPLDVTTSPTESFGFAMYRKSERASERLR